MAQSSEWWRWFEARRVEPFVVNHEEFVADPVPGVEAIAGWLGVADDERDPITIPAVERQSDAVSEQWLSQYIAESRASRAPAA
jgi:LPS sulfotransferase NodH